MIIFMVSILLCGIIISACNSPQSQEQEKNVPEELNFEGVNTAAEAMELFAGAAGKTTDQAVRDKLFRDLLSWMEDKGSGSVSLYMNIRRAVGNIGEEYNGHDSLDIVKKLNTIYLNNPENIPDKKFRDKMKKMAENGLVFATAEGDVWPVVNYHYLKERFGELLSQQLNDYLELKGNGLNNFNEGAPMISWDALSGRIVNMENFLHKYPELKEAGEIKERYHYLLSVYLRGGIHMPGKIREELRQSHRHFLEQYKNTDTCPVVKKFHSLLKKNNFTRTQEVNDFDINAHLKTYLQK
ncbi:MAG: hypothetical protein K9L17_10035 [Clostridiales bacterium]|nr:hypothetical protein [Clostridiales bacterium]